MKALKNLFAAKRRPVQATPRLTQKSYIRKARLDVEGLGERLMPSVTSWLDNTGTLYINSDNASDKVALFNDNIISHLLIVTDVNAGVSKNYLPSAVQRFEFQGNGGDDVFLALGGVTIPGKMYGGDGNDILRGGAGNDWFDGGNGNDTLYGGLGNDYFKGSAGIDNYYGEAGNDLLFRNGYNPAFNGGDGKDVVLGMNAGMTNSSLHYTNTDLSQSGDFTAALSGNLVTLTGPSGIGLQLTGTWKASGGKIISTGNVMMKTALGDIQVATSATPISISLEPDKWSGSATDTPGYESYGVVRSVNWTGMPISTTSGPFSQFSQKLGINVDVPGVSWGLNLGSNLGSLDAPLNPAVPYFYVSIGSGFSASYGGMEASLGGGNVMTVIADPTDPFLYVKVAEFAVAGSLKGQIPFVPEAQPDGVTDHIYGNIYGSGSFDLQGLPITVSGNVVIDLDANNDGVWVGLSNRPWKETLRNPISAASAIMNDIAFGANGSVGAGFEKGGFDLSIPLGNASVLYTPGNFSFRGTSANPFAGTPLESIAPQSGFDFQGRISNWGRDWNITAKTYQSAFAGLSASDLTVNFGNTGATVSAHVTGLMGIGQLSINGWITSNGDFGLVGHASLDIDIGIGEAHAWADVGFVKEGNSVRFNVDMGANFQLGSDGFNIHGGFRMQASVLISSAGLQFSGSGSADIGVTLFGQSADLSLGFSIDNHGLTIDLPLISQDIVIHW